MAIVIVGEMERLGLSPMGDANSKEERTLWAGRIGDTSIHERRSFAIHPLEESPSPKRRLDYLDANGRDKPGHDARCRGLTRLDA
jgi:hypothetical protein